MENASMTAHGQTLLAIRHQGVGRRPKVLGCGTIRDKAGQSGTKPVFAVVLRGAAARRCSRLLSRVFPPSAIVEGGGWTVLTPLEKRV